jgi:hypothetical protein
VDVAFILWGAGILTEGSRQSSVSVISGQWSVVSHKSSVPSANGRFTASLCKKQPEWFRGMAEGLALLWFQEGYGEFA